MVQYPRRYADNLVEKLENVQRGRNHEVTRRTAKKDR